MSGPGETQYVFEQKIWFIAAAFGLLLAAFSSCLLFTFFGLQALVLAANVAQFGVTGIAATLIASVLITRVIANRLLELGFVTISSVGLFFSRRFLYLDEIDPEEAEEFCTTGQPLIALGFLLFATIFTGTFTMTRWTCDTARPEGGFTHAACVFYDPGLFQDVLLSVIRLMSGGFGIAGIFLFTAFVLEIRFLWRRSGFQARYQSASLYDWLHPMKSFQQDLEKMKNDEER